MPLGGLLFQKTAGVVKLGAITSLAMVGSGQLRAIRAPSCPLRPSNHSRASRKDLICHSDAIEIMAVVILSQNGFQVFIGRGNRFDIKVFHQGIQHIRR